MTEDPDASTDIGNCIVSIGVFLAEEVSDTL
jgi:hypothetical protein